MKSKDSQRIPDNCEPQWDCLRCGQRMQKWKHAPDWVPPKGKGWFRFWYECLNKNCRTRQVMPKAGFVRAGGNAPVSDEPEPASLFDERTLVAEDLQRLGHFREL